MNSGSIGSQLVRINGTKVECKGSKRDAGQEEKMSINGTKMECKGSQGDCILCRPTCINGTKVECKDRTGIAPLLIQLVLMEPKWNIKQGYFLVRVTGKLIES